MEFENNLQERAVLVGLNAQSMETRDRSSDSSLEELTALVETAGGVSVISVLQNRPSPDPRSFIGDGKVREVKDLVALQSEYLYDEAVRAGSDHALIYSEIDI